TVQFTKALMELNLPQPLIPIWEDWRPYAGHNLYFCFGLNRKYYFRSLGSLAMPELFDPDRNRAVVAGFERAYREVKPECEYFRNHIEGDEEHGERWLEYVITPIVKAQPEAGMELAIGGALRMEAMRRYNEYLATKFQLSEQTSEQVKVIC
ncbi:MAG: iron-containing redox enzyme family protein, partial [Microcystis panniformis]